MNDPESGSQIIDGPSPLTKGEAARLLQSEDRGDLDLFFHEHTGLAESTARTYRASWEDFLSWCRAHDHEAIPATPEGISDYLQSRSGLSVATLRNRLSAIRLVHRRLQLGDPTDGSPAAQTRKKIIQEKSTEAGMRSPAERLGISEYSPSRILNGGTDLLDEYLEEVFGEGSSSKKEEKHVRERRRARQMWEDPVIDRTTASLRRLTEDQKNLVPSPEFDLPVMRDRAAILLMGAGGASRAEVARMDLLDVLVSEPEGEEAEEEGGEADLTDEERLEEHLLEDLKDDSGAPGQSETLDESEPPANSGILVGVRKKSGMPDRALCFREEEALSLCPARALTAWIVGAGLTGGPLFRAFGSHGSLKERRIGVSSVNLLVKNAAEGAGLDPDQWTPSRLSKEEGPNGDQAF